MAKKKTGLGISQAVQEVKENIDKKATSHDDFINMKITVLSINTLVEYPDNEEYFGNLGGEEFEELCQSIKKRGILQPIVVRPMNDQYQILAGHQRTQGSKAIGQIKIPAIIKDVDDTEARWIWLETNIRSRHLTSKQLGKALDEAGKLLKIQAEKDGIEIKGKVSHILAEKFDMKPRSVEELLMITRKVAESVRELDISKASMAKMAKLSKEEQEALITLLGEETIQSLTATEIEKTVAKMKEEMQNLDNSYKRELEVTQKELENKEKELLSANDLFTGISKEFQEVQNKKNDLEIRIYEEKSKRLELQDKLEKSTSADKEELEKQIKEKDNEIDEMLKESLKTIEEAKELEEKIEEINAEKEMIQTNLQNLEHDYKTLYDDRKKMITENEELKKKLEEANKPPADYENLKKELQELKEKDNIQTTLISLLSELSHTQSIVENLDVLDTLTESKHIEIKEKIKAIALDVYNKIEKL